MKLYSQRLKENNPQQPLVYDSIPQEFIQQYFYIAEDFFNTLPKPLSERHRYWEYLCRKYCLEKGIPLLGEDSECYYEELMLYLKSSETCVEDILDVLELTFSLELVQPVVFFTAESKKRWGDFLDEYFQDKQEHFLNLQKKYVDDLNQRFRQHNLGYELVNGQIIRKESELLVQETIIPAFALLKDNRFSSAEDEMQKAFRFRRAGENAEAILNAAKAFESVMKVICSEMGYEYDADKDTAKNLISHLEKNAFYPPSLNNHIANIRTTLESALPTVRNKKSGHGAGTASTYISDAFADYALHLAATNIVFLVDLFNEKKTQA